MGLEIETPISNLIAKGYNAVSRYFPEFDSFDYRDWYAAKTMLLRLGETTFVSVLKDSCAAWNVMSEFLTRITGPLSPLQLREIMARAAAIYLHLEHLPRFSSSFDADTRKYTIEADHPGQIAMNEIQPSVYGPLLESACGDIIDILEPAKRDQIRGFMRAGRWGFLFDGDGKFDRRSMEPKDSEGNENPQA